MTGKYNHYNLYNSNDVPDHLLQEIDKLLIEITTALLPIMEKSNPNIFSNALCYAHVSVLGHITTKERDALESVAKITSQAILANMELLIREFEKRKKENSNDGKENA